MADEKVLDFAVIGGGVGGVYSAWRLKQARPDATVALFEYSDRIGGKLFSVALPGMRDVYAELGGMRYIEASQPLVTGLIAELGLASRPFPMGSPEPVGDKKNFVYMRRRHFYNEQFSDPQVTPYDLDWAEIGRSPNEITDNVLRMLVPNYAELSFDDWFEVKAFGKYLWEWGYWNLLYRVLTPEAYAYLRDGLGYDTNVANGNAVNLMFTAGDTSGQDQYRTLVKGYESLPRAVAKQFEEIGGDLRRNQRLAALEGDASGGYTLHFEETTTDGYRTRGTGRRHSLRAEHVILGLPRRSIELVDWAAKQDDPFLRRNLDSVIVQTAFKLFLGYPQPWWHALGLQAGRSITDLPIRQTYYFGTEGEISGSREKGNLNSLLMASYNDLATVPFWKGLEAGERFPGLPNPWTAGGADECETLHESITPSRQLVEEAQRQIVELHGQRALPEPYTAAYMDWGEDPFGGGWHSWKAGYRYNEVMPKMRQPVDGQKIYICGAAYSSDQGWVEGALETAELMLRENLGIGEHACSRGWQHDPLKNLKARMR